MHDSNTGVVEESPAGTWEVKNRSGDDHVEAKNGHDATWHPLAGHTLILVFPKGSVEGGAEVSMVKSGGPALTLKILAPSDFCYDLWVVPESGGPSERARGGGGRPKIIVDRAMACLQSLLTHSGPLGDECLKHIAAFIAALCDGSRSQPTPAELDCIRSALSLVEPVACAGFFRRIGVYT